MEALGGGSPSLGVQAGARVCMGQKGAVASPCALPQGRPGVNGLKGEKGEPGLASVGFGVRVSVLRSDGCSGMPDP